MVAVLRFLLTNDNPYLYIVSDMKKAYIKPDIEIVEFVSEVLMEAGSVKVEGLPGIGEGEGENTGPDANRHRGEWGNLWAN